MNIEEAVAKLRSWEKCNHGDGINGTFFVGLADGIDRLTAALAEAKSGRDNYRNIYHSNSRCQCHDDEACEHVQRAVKAEAALTAMTQERDELQTNRNKLIEFEENYRKKWLVAEAAAKEAEAAVFRRGMTEAIRILKEEITTVSVYSTINEARAAHGLKVTVLDKMTTAMWQGGGK